MSSDLSGLKRVGLKYASQNNGGAKVYIYASKDFYYGDTETVLKEGTLDVTNLTSVGYTYASQNNGGAVVSFIALDEYTDDAEAVKAAAPMSRITTENTGDWNTYVTGTEPVTNRLSGTKHIYLYISKSGWCGNYKNIILSFSNER